jgi:hypothetical protein
MYLALTDLCTMPLNTCPKYNNTAHNIGEAKVILRKQDCSDDTISCKKTGDKVVKSLYTKIFAGNLSCEITSVEADKYDVTVDALSWQTILKSICCFCTQYVDIPNNDTSRS